MKSTASAALASLKHKFNAKILEVGKLKNEVKALKFGEAYGKGTDGSRQLAQQAQQLNSQLRTIRELQVELNAQDSVLTKTVRRANSTEALLRDSKSSVENWKSLAVVLCIVGVTLGSLAQYAYTLNVAA